MTNILAKEIKYDDYNAGILWWYQNKENIFITKDGLELLQTPITSKTLSRYIKDIWIMMRGNERPKKTSPILLSNNEEIEIRKTV